MGRQNESGQSGDENIESKVWGILLANSGVRNVGPPAQYSQCLCCRGIFGHGSNHHVPCAKLPTIKMA